MAVLSNQFHASRLRERYPLDEQEAKALAYARAGWAAYELHEVIFSSQTDMGELVQSARETVGAGSEVESP